MEPITYDYVHGFAPSMMPGEYIDWNEAMIDLMGEKDYDRLIRKLTGFSDEDEEEVFEESDDGSEEEPEDGQDHEEPVQEDDGFWDGFEDCLRIMFPDPIADATETFGSEDDELSIVADYWTRLDRRIIDELIGFAEAMA